MRLFLFAAPVAAIGGVYLARRFLMSSSDAFLNSAARVVGAEPGEKFPCSVFAALTLNAYQGRTDRGTSSKWWQDMNVWDRSRPWSPIEANRASGDSLPFFPEAGDFQAGSWYLCQSWRSLTGANRTIGPNDRGHAWFWHAMGDRTGHVLDSDENRGPRYAGANFGPGSTTPGAAVSWSDRKSLYPGGIACVRVA